MVNLRMYAWDFGFTFVAGMNAGAGLLITGGAVLNQAGSINPGLAMLSISTVLMLFVVDMSSLLGEQDG